jgi:hypothetical protein
VCRAVAVRRTEPRAPLGARKTREHPAMNILETL